ncbi:hypothetical protein ACP70R_011625 [Stipagrostis hirtigluma subsp. patula]
MDGDPHRRATEDGRPLLPHQSNHANKKLPLFLRARQNMFRNIQTMSAKGLLIISALNLSTALTVKANDEPPINPHARAILVSLPYAFLPFGFAGLAAAIAVKAKPRLFSCASGCLLAELMHPTILASVVVVARHGADPGIWGVVAVIILMNIVPLVLAWSFMMFGYPKFLRCCCCAVNTEEEEEEEETSGNGDKAAAEEPEPVVTKPEMARLVTISSVVFSAVVIIMFIYVVYVHFKIDGPLWEALVSVAAVSPLFIVPLCMVPMLRDPLVRIYAVSPPDNDLTSKLLGSENV